MVHARLHARLRAGVLRCCTLGCMPGCTGVLRCLTMGSPESSTPALPLGPAISLACRQRAVPHVPQVWAHTESLLHHQQ